MTGATTWGEISALAPAGQQAARLERLWWTFFTVCAVVYVAVMIALVVALLARRAAGEGHRPGNAREYAVAGAGVVTTVVLLVLLVASVRAGQGLNPMPGGAGLAVKVIGHQWWWELQYQGNPPSQMVTTANELHIPVGTPVLLQLQSADVIHSFWVPSLHGKRDLIPGHESTTYIRADRAGVFRGQCAEFCGDQHANMALLVVAEPQAAFQHWLAQQRKIAPEPTTTLAARGRDVFMAGPCPMCHTILGTIAGSQIGPDLTHIASRMSLAAATRPNTRGHLAGWIVNAQSIKPGSRMPPMPLRGDELQALLAYLETLQ